MMLDIAHVLNAEQIRQCREALEQAEWIDGRTTAGHVAVKAKNNLQLPLDHPVARQLGEFIVGALSQNPSFISAVLPLRILL